MITKGFKKTAAGWNSAALDKAGLKVLMAPAAFNTYKGIKDKKPGEAAAGGVELGGLALLHRAVSKAHP